MEKQTIKTLKRLFKSLNKATVLADARGKLLSTKEA